MSNNTYTVDGRSIIDADGNSHAVETWHHMPLPDGLCDESGEIQFGGWIDGGKYTHWLARAPLPSVPKVKKQEDIDFEALNNWWIGRNNQVDVKSAWFAALVYERSRAK